MKANELRIGNYVFDNLGGTLKIKGINENSDISHIKPIPLTEQWLFKFGFDSCINGFWCPKELLNVKISKFSVTQIFISGSDTDLAFNGTEYVHQFQNLYFALTGEELKEVNNG